jgi:hypothetical protein
VLAFLAAGSASSGCLRRGGSLALGEDFFAGFVLARGFGATFFATSAGVTWASGSAREGTVSAGVETGSAGLAGALRGAAGRGGAGAGAVGVVRLGMRATTAPAVWPATPAAPRRTCPAIDRPTLNVLLIVSCRLVTGHPSCGSVGLSPQSSTGTQDGPAPVGTGTARLSCASRTLGT